MFLDGRVVAEAYHSAAVKAGSRPPWLGLGAAVWVQASAGTSFTFALYSHALKVALGTDESQIVLLGVACSVGDSLGLLPGVVCSKLHPTLLLLLAAASGLLGYGATWLAVSGVAPALPYWLVKKGVTSGWVKESSSPPCGRSTASRRISARVGWHGLRGRGSHGVLCHLARGRGA